jgi:hypothetical protein
VARIRSVKPELRDSRLVASWPFEVRYFWVLLWGYLDDKGRGLDLPKRIAGDCFPHDEIDGRDIDKWLTLMGVGRNGEEGPVCRYEVAGNAYIHCRNWPEHQKPNRPTPSRLPPCPRHEQVTAPLTESRTERRNAKAVPGAAEQRSRGAEEQQQLPRESHTNGDRRIVEEATDATPQEAEAVIALVVAENRHRNLGGFLRRLASDGDLDKLLTQVRTNNQRAAVRTARKAANNGPPCPHEMPGGALLHPVTQKPWCPHCRREPNPDDAGNAREPIDP